MDQQTFQATVFIYKDKMFRFAKRMLVDEEDAFDRVQDVMLKLWQKREELYQYKNLEAFAMRCIKNECINKLRHDEVEKAYTTARILPTTTETDPGNMRDIILDILNNLPEKQKMVVHLKDVEEFSIPEIADTLEMEENAVRVNLMRGRQKIKSQLEKIFEYEKQQFSK